MPLPKAPRTATIRAAFAVPVLLAAQAAAPGAAHAHAVLVASTPPAGGTVAPGALGIALRYNSRIDRVRSMVTLVRPDGTAERLGVNASGAPDQLSAAAVLAPGAYTLRWQVLATDGHITHGDVAFSVAAPGIGVKAGTQTPPGTDPARTAGN